MVERGSPVQPRHAELKARWSHAIPQSDDSCRVHGRDEVSAVYDFPEDSVPHMKRSFRRVGFVWRAAAVAVVGAFLFVPTLARLQDHLSSADTGAGFKLSKNIERPHDKQTTAALVAISALSLGPDRSLAYLLTVPDVDARALHVESRLSARAPPRL